MIRLRWLKMQGFRSFAEETKIVFPESGLVLIRGSNPETGDSSGSGKSSLLLAIAYVLDILPKGFPATELQNWDSQFMQVDLALDVGGQEVVLGRGKKGYVKKGDKSITGAKAIAEEQARILGLSPEIFGALTYRAQNTPGLFLSKADSEKKEFLTQVLGLDAIEAAVDVSDARVKDLRPKLEVACQQMNQAGEALAAVKAAKPVPELVEYDAVEPVEILEHNLAFWQAKLDQANAGILEEQKGAKFLREQEISGIQFKLDQARDYLSKLREADRARQEEFRKQQQVYQQQIRQYDATLQQIDHLKQERSQKTKDLAACRQGNCPTCARQWDDSRRKQEELEKRLLEIEANVGGEAVLLGSRSQAKKELEAMSFSSDPAIEKLVGINTKLSTELKALHSQPLLPHGTAHDSLAREANKKVVEAQMVLQAGRSQIALNQARRDASARELKQYELRLQDAEQRSNDLSKSIATLSAEMNIERDFAALMGREGFLGVIFEEVLREIADEANQRLGRLANVSHVSIGFRTETLTATKGTVRRSIQTIVNIAGREAKMETGLSGGMKTSVEQVVDLAVMTVVQRRTGRIPGWLCLDEVFNGQGTATKETAMEVLREFATDKLVLVVDHGTEFQELFSSFIDVTYKDGKSSLN